MNKLKTIVDQLTNSGKSKEDIIKSLSENKVLSRSEKILLYRYLFPRPLLDRELPTRIIENRGESVNGYLTPELSEATLIIEAYRTPQYSRYIRHLMHSFLDPNKIFPILGTKNDHECGICRKTITETGSSNIDTSTETLAWGSEESDITLCINCLIQLKYANDILEVLEPGYLSY